MGPSEDLSKFVSQMSIAPTNKPSSSMSNNTASQPSHMSLVFSLRAPKKRELALCFETENIYLRYDTMACEGYLHNSSNPIGGQTTPTKILCDHGRMLRSRQSAFISACTNTQGTDFEEWSENVLKELVRRGVDGQGNELGHLDLFQ